LSNVRVVGLNHIQNVWPKVKDYLQNAMDHSGGEYKLDHLKMFLVQGVQSLLVAVNEDNEIYCAATIEFINFPDDRVAFITAIGGRTKKQDLEDLCDWAKENGATVVRGAAFESVARLWKLKYGFEKTYVMVEKRL